MDNADDPSFRLLPYIAQSPRGNVIVTTRNVNQAMLAPNSSHHLEGLSMEDAISLILTSSGYEDTEANRELARVIVEELGRGGHLGRWPHAVPARGVLGGHAQ